MVEDNRLVLPRFGAGSVDHANMLESDYRIVHGDKGLNARSEAALGRERHCQERTNGKLRFHLSDYPTDCSLMPQVGGEVAVENGPSPTRPLVVWRRARSTRGPLRFIIGSHFDLTLGWRRLQAKCRNGWVFRNDSGGQKGISRQRLLGIKRQNLGGSVWLFDALLGIA